MSEDTGCCPPFDPEPWDEKRVEWDRKTFIKDRVKSLFHIPLNFGSVMKRNMTMIMNAEALPEVPIVLSDENSLWGADVYIEVTGEVPGAQLVTFQGEYLSKVFEGPYSKARSWCSQMDEYVEKEGEETKKRYFWYTTCPRCAKAYGKNYVVLLSQV